MLLILSHLHRLLSIEVQIAYVYELSMWNMNNYKAISGIHLSFIYMFTFRPQSNLLTKNIWSKYQLYVYVNTANERWTNEQLFHVWCKLTSLIQNICYYNFIRYLAIDRGLCVRVCVCVVCVSHCVGVTLVPYNKRRGKLYQNAILRDTIWLWTRQ